MQFSAPEPDVRVQRINILLVNKNSVDTYAFFGRLKQKYFACSACWTQADQVSEFVIAILVSTLKKEVEEHIVNMKNLRRICRRMFPLQMR